MNSRHHTHRRSSITKCRQSHCFGKSYGTEQKISKGSNHRLLTNDETISIRTKDYVEHSYTTIAFQSNKRPDERHLLLLFPLEFKTSSSYASPIIATAEAREDARA